MSVLAPGAGDACRTVCYLRQIFLGAIPQGLCTPARYRRRSLHRRVSVGLQNSNLLTFNPLRTSRFFDDEYAIAIAEAIVDTRHGRRESVAVHEL